MKLKTWLGLMFLLLGISFGVTEYWLMHARPNLWFLGGALILGALLVDTEDMARVLAEGYKAVRSARGQP